VIEREGCTAQVDLTLATEEHAQGLAASLTYATDLFDAASAERMARHWVNLLRAVVATPQGKLVSWRCSAPTSVSASSGSGTPPPMPASRSISPCSA
jgi:non-ribosomal peptide synthetase component F